jgi:hypothetical protein
VVGAGYGEEIPDENEVLPPPLGTRPQFGSLTRQRAFRLAGLAHTLCCSTNVRPNRLGLARPASVRCGADHSRSFREQDTSGTLAAISLLNYLF